MSAPKPKTKPVTLAQLEKLKERKGLRFFAHETTILSDRKTARHMMKVFGPNPPDEYINIRIDGSMDEQKTRRVLYAALSALPDVKGRK